MSHRDEFLKNCVVIDTETTDLDYKVAEVIELGRAFMDGDSWITFGELFKPYEPISAEVSSITNITNKMVERCSHFEDFTDNVKEFLDAFGGEAVCVAHNSFYDENVLQRYGIDYPVWICTMRMSQKLFGGDPTVTNFKLPYLRYRFDILDPADHKIEHHRADSDALVTAHLLEYCIDKMEELTIIDKDKPYMSQVLQWLQEPIIYDTMPFGKHKGKPLESVPLDYWMWALENMDSLNEDKDNYDPDFAASVAAALEKIMD